MGDNFEEHNKLPELKLGTTRTIIFNPFFLSDSSVFLLFGSNIVVNLGFMCGRCQTSSRVSLILQKAAHRKRFFYFFSLFFFGFLVWSRIVLFFLGEMVGYTFHFPICRTHEPFGFLIVRLVLPLPLLRACLLCYESV